ncbi:MAG: D-2-hydroxyacid dehydrogenase [Acidobacteria bacterium]|nr:D-2-hydroxyacid dehydrogenase [Acidobacteriota bacterium]
MPKPEETKLVACVRHPFDQWRFPARLVEEIRRRYPGITVVHLEETTHLADEIAAADIFVGWNLKPEQFARAARLQWIHATAAGVEQLMREEIRRSPVVITNASSVLTLPMAEHTLALMLALARRIPSAVRYQEKRHWAQQEIWDESPHPRELSGSTLVVVGYGAVGRELGRRVRALAMKVIGVKRDPSRGADYADRVVAPERLEQALGEGDFVVLATPVTPATERLFGQRQFAAMKPSAYFINIARGVLVDTDALVAALRERVIAGAAVDVAEREPLAPESPLWTAPNLLLTPHLAAASEPLWQRQAALLFENLDRWFAGRPLLNQVDKDRGY